MINDLAHTTGSETIGKGEQKNAQTIADDVVDLSRRNKVLWNNHRWKELRISFLMIRRDFRLIVIGGENIKIVYF